ncbi:phosphate/phosphite/phosphonate ABC transporter substrate-binding protein [Flavihumibacter petaseus]|uniref:Putative ABC transporter substrate-binding protein n=1 Tax=Flavihumibacter petaseus NBRC 106054 TaxID=1220578 RepID=A0A0E9N337_9BACT|nr:PhnD/SsuA/transferrin family substrate-binding protein [Flavihumibacter petaseus]GAO44208.1 putative ABC transporter substrate-binding protein [Flavihumibacter petaseus NBRC 106054]
MIIFRHWITAALLFAASGSLCRAVGQQRPYIFATYTYSTNNRLANLGPLVQYLSQATGREFRAVSYPTVSALISAIQHDSVDFAMMNTSGYLILQRKTPGKAKPLVNLDMQGSAGTNYGGCLIALKSAGYTRLSDLRLVQGRPSLALVNSSSTSGNLVPRLLFNSAGIANPDSSFSLTYAGTHKKVVEAVLSGNAVLGGCGCAEIDSARIHQGFSGKAVAIDSFNNIPLGPVVYRSGTSEPFRHQVSALLTNLNEKDPGVFVNFCNGWTEFKGARGFRKISDQEYDQFRKMFGSNTRLWQLIE